jgi:hypothetical protein
MAQVQVQNVVAEQEGEKMRALQKQAQELTTGGDEALRNVTATLDECQVHLT